MSYYAVIMAFLYEVLLLNLHISWSFLIKGIMTNRVGDGKQLMMVNNFYGSFFMLDHNSHWTTCSKTDN